MFITHRLTVQEVNNLLSESFVRIFGNIVEHFPAAAIGILKCRPFNDPESIIQAVNDLLDGYKNNGEIIVKIVFLLINYIFILLHSIRFLSKKLFECE